MEKESTRYIKLFAEKMDANELLREPDAMAVWIRILINVAWAKYNGVHAGEWLTTISELSDKSGVYRQKVSYLLNLFEKENMVVVVDKNRYGKWIKVVKWTQYQ